MRGRGSPSLFRGTSSSTRGRGGGFRGRGGRGGFGGPVGPPDSVIEFGEIMHNCQDELVCRCTLDQQVPYFNGRVFLENKQEIGKVDEILGPINKFMFSVKIGDNMKAASFKQNTKLYIDPHQVLPLSRFLPKPPAPKGIKASSSNNKLGFSSRGGRGGRGGGRGGGGFSRPMRGRGRGGF